MIARPAVTFALAVLVTAGSVHAEPGPGDTSARPDDAARALVQRELARHLSPDQIDRLLREPRVARALDDLLEGWDGVGDSLEVERKDDAIVLRTLVRERRCLARLGLGPEIGPVEPRCDEALREDGDRKLVLDAELWRAPERAPRARRPPPERVANVETPLVPAEPTGPVENTVLRRARGHDVDLGPVALARSEHDRLKDAIRRPHWHDPLLPSDPVVAGEALRPLAAPTPAIEARVESNLRNPFDEARMRTALPMPAGMDLPRDGGAPPLLPGTREECVDEWRLRAHTPDPPTLDCYRRVAWNDRLEDDVAYQTLSRLASVLQLPLLDTIVAIQVGEAVSHPAHRLVWAMVWLNWVEEHPARTAEALARLSPEERRFVRRRVAQWWVEARLAALRPTITRLFERHLLGLYPEATDPDGLPKRAFVADTWLWANNWLTVLDGREDDAIVLAFGRLSAPERKVIAAFAGDPDLRQRWAHAAAVIASL